MRIRINQDIWREASETMCPLVRWSTEHQSYVIQEKDPCPKCHDPACYNTGRKFHGPLICLINEKVNEHQEEVENAHNP